MKRFSTTASSKPKKVSQIHAQAALDKSAIHQSAHLSLVSASSVNHYTSNNIEFG